MNYLRNSSEIPCCRFCTDLYVGILESKIHRHKKLQAFDYQQWLFDLTVTLRAENKFLFAKCEKRHLRPLKGRDKYQDVEIPLTAKGEMGGEELTVCNCTVMLYII